MTHASSNAAWDLALDNFAAHCGAEKGLSSASLDAARFDLARLRSWCETEGLSAPEVIRDHHLRAFLLESAGELAPASRARLLSTLRSFFRFLLSEDLAKVDPTSTLIAPRRGRKGAWTPVRTRRVLRRQAVASARRIRVSGLRST